MNANILTIVVVSIKSSEDKKTAMPAVSTPEKLLIFCQKYYFALTGGTLLLEDAK